MLDYSDIEERLKANTYTDDIATAQRLQLKNQVFTIPFDERSCANDEYNNILKRSKDRIANDKAFNTFEQNISYPLSENKFVRNKVFNALSKIWDGEGGYIDRKTPVENTNQLPSILFYKDVVWDRFIESPNDLIFINRLDGELEYQFISIFSCIYFDFKTVRGSHVLTEVIYTGILDGKKTTTYINEDSWGTFAESIGGKFNVVSNESHNYGFCPVDFISDSLYSESPVIRKNNITESLGDLEDLFMLSTTSSIVDRHIAPYLITTNQKGCEYNTGDEHCKGGFLFATVKDSEDQSIYDGKSMKRCPICNSSGNIGYGSEASVNIQNLTSDEITAAITNAITYVNLDVTSLKYSTERVKEKEIEVYDSITGRTETLNNNQQHNVTRVLSTYEDKTTVIFSTKAIFETLISSIDTKANKILNKSYTFTVVNLGNDFYLGSESQYQEGIKLANETRTESYIDNKKGLIEVKYRGNPDSRDREVLIHELETVLRPFNDLTNEQVLSTERITDKEFYINQEFYRIIRMYEVEFKKDDQVGIHQILADKTFTEKANIINEYINKTYNERQGENTRVDE